MQFSIRSLFLLTAIAAVLCWFAFRVMPPLWPHVADAGYLLACLIPFGAGALLVTLKGSV